MLWSLYPHAESVSFDTAEFYSLGPTPGIAVLSIKPSFSTFQDTDICRSGGSAGIMQVQGPDPAFEFLQVDSVQMQIQIAG